MEAEARSKQAFERNKQRRQGGSTGVVEKKIEKNKIRSRWIGVPRNYKEEGSAGEERMSGRIGWKGEAWEGKRERWQGQGSKSAALAE